MNKSISFLVFTMLMVAGLCTSAQVKISPSWFKKARKGDVNMMNQIASEYQDHNMVDSAIYWHTEAAKRGNVNSQSSLGQLYEKMEKPDYEKSFYWYMKAAEQGYNWAQFKVGHYYHYGQGVKKDNALASKWLYAAAKQGYCYGFPQYEYGWYFAPDSEIKYWLLLSVDAGYIEALNAIGEGYQTGHIGVDADSAFHYFTLAADKGNENAYWYLSECYARGNGCPQSFKKALKMYRKAERLESGRLALDKTINEKSNSIWWYDKERQMEVLKNDASYYWYREVAYHNDLLAKYWLMQCYLYGSYGVEVGYEEMSYWCEEAAKGGLIEAQILLARTYDSMNDVKNARYWYKKVLDSELYITSVTTEAQIQEIKEECRDALKKLSGQ